MTSDEFGLCGGRIEDRYEIDKAVAAGGFGTVYYGRHRALRTPVAVKVLRIPKELTEAERRDFAQRFLAEAQTIGQLQHPAVVRALDFGVSPMPNGETVPWMVLEWVDGPTLKETLDARRGQPMSPREALTILRPVLEALAAAHTQGIAHRDIKPANIMLPRGVGALASRVLDFGIAKAMRPDELESSGETRTKSSLSAFSLKYAAPEQVVGMRTGPWTDVHALGLVLTEMVSGAESYPGNDAMEVTVAAISPVRPTPAARGVDVGPWEHVIARAVAFKTTDRFANAAELLAALEQSAPAEVRASSPRMSSAPPFVTAPTAPSLSSTLPVTGPMQDSLLPFARPSAPPPARGLSRTVKALAATMVAAVLVGGAVVVTRRDPTPATPATSAAPSLPAAPSTVRIEFDNLPPHGSVSFDGLDRGEVREVSVARRAGVAAARVTAPGYAPLEFSVPLDRDRHVALPPLTPLAVAAPPQPVAPSLAVQAVAPSLAAQAVAPSWAAQPVVADTHPVTAPEPTAAPRGRHHGHHGGRDRGGVPQAGAPLVQTPVTSEVGSGGVRF